MDYWNFARITYIVEIKNYSLTIGLSVFVQIGTTTPVAALRAWIVLLCHLSASPAFFPEVSPAASDHGQAA